MPDLSVGGAPSRVVVVGDVMVDVLVEVDAALAYASDTPSRIATAPGGSAANVAVWLARAGARVGIVASIGRDPFGQAAVDALVAEGVDVSGVERTDRPTGTVVALVEPDGQRSMLTDRGANLALDAVTVEAALRRHMAAGPVHVHVSGYCLLDDATRAAGRRALDVAAELGASRSVGASSAGPLLAMGPRRFLELVEGCDYLFCNLEEGRALSGELGVDDALAALARSFGEVVLTLGELGAVAAGPDGHDHRTPPHPVPVADTVGAGDGFAATYLAARLAGADVDAALVRAASVAADAIADRGARRWVGGYSRS